MRRIRRSYEKPLRPWDKATIERNKKIKKEYGLRRKKEILRAESILRNYRRLARDLAANRDETKEAILMAKLRKFGLVNEGASLDDVLALTINDILERRLQTIVYKKGFAKTPKQARQFIVHGHIALDGHRIRWPSALVPVDKEGSISFYHRSTVKDVILGNSVKKKTEVKEEPQKEESVEEKESVKQGVENE